MKGNDYGVVLRYPSALYNYGGGWYVRALDLLSVRRRAAQRPLDHFRTVAEDRSVHICDFVGAVRSRNTLKCTSRTPRSSQPTALTHQRPSSAKCVFQRFCRSSPCLLRPPFRCTERRHPCMSSFTIRLPASTYGERSWFTGCWSIRVPWPRDLILLVLSPAHLSPGIRCSTEVPF